MFEHVAFTDGELESIIRNAAKNNMNGSDPNEADSRFSLESNYASISDDNIKPYYMVPFTESVDKALEGMNNKHGLVFVRNTPAVFKTIGIPALPILITKQHIRDIYLASAPNGRNSHDLKEQINPLPECRKLALRWNKNPSTS